jgi:hypothetical protein
VRKARINADAVLPTGQVSGLWADDEMVDLVTEANEEINLRFQLVHKKWGLQTVTQADAPFVRDGEIYTPSTALKIAPQSDIGGHAIATRITLPPDFGEMVRVMCVSNRTVRFLPATIEMSHWIDAEQGSFETAGIGVLPSTPDGMTFYYDIIGNRTMILIPSVTQTFNIAIDYIPMKRPLYYTSQGTITLTQGTTGITGAGTAFQSAGVFSEISSQACELIVGVSSISDATIALATDYPRVASITSDTVATFVSNYGPVGGAGLSYILTMVPTLPRVYHRWISRLATCYMLAKVSPQLASEYAQGVIQKFGEVIQPTARVRQSQESPVVEDSEEFGTVGGPW